MRSEQLDIFKGRRKLVGPAPQDDLLKESHEIVSKAIIDTNPYAICVMVSGGDDYWVNIIHWWTKKQCLDFLNINCVQRNPVSIALNRSGECNCGTMQSEADRIAASDFDPDWGKWMLALRKEITAKFGWDIGQNPKKETLLELKQKAMHINEFMPMCVGCKSRAQQSKLF